MARNIAAADPRTLAAALTAQAQRTLTGIVRSSMVSPLGNGIPIGANGICRAKYRGCGL